MNPHLLGDGDLDDADELPELLVLDVRFSLRSPADRLRDLDLRSGDFDVSLLVTNGDMDRFDLRSGDFVIDCRRRIGDRLSRRSR